MENIIKIRISRLLLEQLDKDCQSFELLKKDSSPNRNHLINALIKNYYDDYLLKEEHLIAVFKNSFPDLDENKLKNIFFNLERNSFESKEDLSKTLTIKINKENQINFSYLESSLNGMTLSNFFRALLYSYSNLKSEERERVIFKENFNKLKEAIDEKKMIYYLVKDGSYAKKSLPYKLVASNSTGHYYLLSKDFSKTNSFILRPHRLNRLKQLSILKETNVFTEEDILRFDRMEKYGPEYLYLNNYSIRVMLTNKGKRLFDSYYVHRPIPSSIDEGIYTFEGDQDQILSYFAKFGKEAKIISPKKISRRMKDFFLQAYLNYEE